MKKHTQPKHDKQNEALLDIWYLHRALYDIHRATDGDGIPTCDLEETLGISEDGWTEKASHPDTKTAIDNINWFLYNKNGRAWAEHCGPLKSAFRAVLREIKKRLTDTDWTPCTCKECTKHHKK